MGKHKFPQDLKRGELCCIVGEPERPFRFKEIRKEKFYRTLKGEQSESWYGTRRLVVYGYWLDQEDKYPRFTERPIMRLPTKTKWEDLLCST